MSVSIERLGPGDEATLELLAREDADFDLDGRRDSLPPLEPGMAQRYRANPGVLHWVAVQDGVVTSFSEEPQPVYLTRVVEPATKKVTPLLLSFE